MNNSELHILDKIEDWITKADTYHTRKDEGKYAVCINAALELLNALKNGDEICKKLARMKPQPKFKAGDYVRDHGLVYRVIREFENMIDTAKYLCMGQDGNDRILEAEDMKKWEPQPFDKVLGWLEKESEARPDIFMMFTDDDKYKYLCFGHTAWEHVKPYFHDEYERESEG